MRNDIEWVTSKKPTNLNQLKEFEKVSGLKFPASYVELMLKFNGAEINNYITSFVIYYEDGTKYPNVFGVGAFLAFGEENVRIKSDLVEWNYDKSNFDSNYPLPDFLIPISEDGGGNLVCFDYRHDHNTDNPRVVFWLHEEAGQLEEGLEVYFIANSFDEFLECLFDNRTQAEKIRDAKIRKEYLEMFGSK
ncbi:SMI1/KNR4 family protein [Pigmentibacter ruber]